MIPPALFADSFLKLSRPHYPALGLTSPGTFLYPVKSRFMKSSFSDRKVRQPPWERLKYGVPNARRRDVPLEPGQVGDEQSHGQA